MAANEIGAQRILKLIEKYGLDVYKEVSRRFMEYGERISLQELKKIPNGTYKETCWIENDGFGKGPFPIKLN